MRIPIFLLFLFATTLTAQEETLLSFDSQTGGFGAPVLKYTTIRGQQTLMLGGRGGWVFDNCFVVGGGAYGLITEVDAPPGVMPLEGPLNIKLSTFGFELEYLFDPSSLTHVSLYLLCGGAATNYAKDVGSTTENQQTGETAFMLAFEPAVNAELNVLPWFRIDAGVSYLWVSTVHQQGLTADDFRGLGGTVTLKFGDF